MSYINWFEKHAQKHQEIINKLDGFSDDDIIKYFRFENMVEKEIDFCPLYEKNKKCHDIENLNCYLCGCPNFRLTSVKSFCDINSKNGGTIKGKDGFIHQNCTNCIVPHDEKYIKKYFDKNWSKIMKDVI